MILICCSQMVGTDMTLFSLRYDWLMLQEASGSGQPLRTEGSSLSRWSKAKQKTESGTDLQASQSCVGLKERGALSLPNVKIASSFPTMTLSHKYSTSPTSSSSPPSHTQQLFKRCTRGCVQYRWMEVSRLALKTCHTKFGTIFHVVLTKNDSISYFWTAFCSPRLGLNKPLVPPLV